MIFVVHFVLQLQLGVQVAPCTIHAKLPLEYHQVREL